MPVQIMELNISVSVTQPGGGQQGNAPQPPQNSSGQDQHEAILDECVAQVMKVLNDKKER